MPTLSTGVVPVAGYGTKTRRTMYAQLKDDVKSGKVDSKEIAYKVGMLNKMLFDTLVNRLGLGKRDVVRIRINYDVDDDGKIVWDFNSLQIEVWKLSEELSEKAVSEFKKVLEQEQLVQKASYRVVKLGATPLGEEIYSLESEEKRFGAIKIMRINDNVVVVGAVLNPPRMIRAVIPPPESIEATLPTLLSRGVEVSEEEARKIIEEITSELTSSPP